MASLYSDLLTIVRNRLIESTANYWTDAELFEMMFTGTRDLWRDVVDLKQEHYMIIDNDHVSYPPNSTTLLGVPANVHKIFNIEPRDMTENGPNHGLQFKPLKYNDDTFAQARGRLAMDPTNSTIYYTVHDAGAPVGAPTVVVAPMVTSNVLVSFAYVPVLGVLASTNKIPIPGEADNAVIAWAVAFARAKERED